jgi:hypothetical protein
MQKEQRRSYIHSWMGAEELLSKLRSHNAAFLKSRQAYSCKKNQTLTKSQDWKNDDVIHSLCNHVWNVQVSLCTVLLSLGLASHV